QTKLLPLAVWDGIAGDGTGGTASAVERWQKCGLNVEIINLGELLRDHVLLARRAAHFTETTSAGMKEAATEFAPEIRALFFADAAGYSKLNDEEIPRFVQHFLGLVANLAAESPNKPLIRNTWGDALYFVFSDVRSAGQFALDLTERVQSTDWSSKRLPA